MKIIIENDKKQLAEKDGCIVVEMPAVPHIGERLDFFNVPEIYTEYDKKHGYESPTFIVTDVCYNISYPDGVIVIGADEGSEYSTTVAVYVRNEEAPSKNNKVDTEFDEWDKYEI